MKAFQAMRRGRSSGLVLVLSCLLLVSSSCSEESTVYIDSHQHGSFALAVNGLVTVTGRLLPPSRFESLEINGINVPLEFEFSVDVPVDVDKVFNRITMVATRRPGGSSPLVQEETFVIAVVDDIASQGRFETNYAENGVGLRVSDLGLDQIAPVVEGLSAGALDISTLITAQNPIAQGSMSGINFTANVVEVGFGGFALDIDSAPGGVVTDMQIDDFFLEIDLDLGFLGSCTLEIDTTATNITGTYDLVPDTVDPTSVDVNLVSAISVVLSGFNSTFVSGICDDPLLGDIIGLIISEGDIQQLMEDGFADNLADPDGAGPQDSVLAAAIQDALGGISIADPVGAALGATLDAPINSIDEEASGLTLSSDSKITTLTYDPNAPDLYAYYQAIGAPPTFGPLTPDGQLPYGMAFSISTGTMNQLLKAQIEQGLLQDEITEILGLPINAALLAQLFPGLGFLNVPAGLAFTIQLRPTFSPLMTGSPGPSGEFTELIIGALEVDIASVFGVAIRVQIDVSLGLDLLFTNDGLEFDLAPPLPGDIEVEVLINELSGTEQAIKDALAAVFPAFLPQLTGALEAFPIPSFLGLELEPVEVASLGGGYMGLFANLLEAPTTKIENVVFSDFSSGDFQQSGGCWLREWRHRVSGSQLGNAVSVNARGMLGADAGCTTNDAASNANLVHRVNFDVVSVPGEEWTLDVDHSVLGALNRISDGYNDGFGFQDGGGSATFGVIVASYSTTGGASGNFDIVATPSPTHISDGYGGSSSNEDVEFSGTNGVTLVGTGDVSVQLDFAVNLDGYSDSRTAFPTCNGDEMAIRLGKNDTIDSNFTAGGYPGMGSRNIADDGHKVAISLTSEVLP